MKNLLLSSVALLGLTAAATAADLPARAPAPAPFVPMPVFTWTGFYVGPQLGYAWSGNNDEFAAPTNVYTLQNGVLVPLTVTGFSRGDSDGFLLGAHAGYNMQLGAFVLGLEGDIEGIFGDDGDDDPFAGVVLRDVNGNIISYNFGPRSLDWQGSLRARLGVAFDQLLVYGTGGWAFGGVSGGFGNGFFDNGDDTLTGWTLGAGVEWAFTSNMTARLEYRYTNYDREGDIFNNVSLGGDDFDFHTIKAGVSFKF